MRVNEETDPAQNALRLRLGGETLHGADAKQADCARQLPGLRNGNRRSNSSVAARTESHRQAIDLFPFQRSLGKGRFDQVKGIQRTGSRPGGGCSRRQASPARLQDGDTAVLGGKFKRQDVHNGPLWLESSVGATY